MRTIALGSDHAGFQLKEIIARHLVDKGFSLLDCGVGSEDRADYPDIAAVLVRSLQAGSSELGILICGTGIGMSVSANKYRGIRAALCHETYSARCAREHNDANVLTLGARVTGAGLALTIVEAFLNASFQGGRHSGRLAKICRIEEVQAP